MNLKTEFKNVKECVYDKLYDDLVKFVKLKEAEDNFKRALGELADYYINKIAKIQLKIRDIDEDNAIIDNLIDEFWVEKVPLIVEAFGKDAKEYLDDFYKNIKEYAKECQEKEKEEILYEDEDLKVVIKDGIKKVIYKNKTEEISEDHPLYIILQKFFEQV